MTSNSTPSTKDEIDMTSKKETKPNYYGTEVVLCNDTLNNIETEA